MGRVTWGLPLLIALGCGSSHLEGSPREILIEVRVESDPGVPLSEVLVAINGERIGKSNAQGLVSSERIARPGELLYFSHDCPPGFAGEAEQTQLRIRRYGGSASSRHVKLTLRCRPKTRLAVFLVRARPAAHVGVYINGALAGNTDSDGIAHISRRAAPGSEFNLELRSQHPDLRPTKISRLFTLHDSHEIFVFDQLYRVRSTPRRSPQSRPRILRIE